jgi:hypothetical protein
MRFILFNFMQCAFISNASGVVNDTALFLQVAAIAY